jgi:hypothetical protein
MCQSFAVGSIVVCNSTSIGFVIARPSFIP